MKPAGDKCRGCAGQERDVVETRRLLGLLLDALVYNASVSTLDWEQACLMGGRFSEPWLTGHPQPAPLDPGRFACSCRERLDGSISWDPKCKNHGIE